MGIDYAETTIDLYELPFSSGGAALRALLGVFPPSFSLEPSFSSQPAIFPRRFLSKFAGAGVTLPWLVWAAADIPGDSHTMVPVGGSWWAYAEGEFALLGIRTELDKLYSLTPLVIPWGRLGVTHRGRPMDDSSLGLVGMETRVGYLRMA